MSAKREERTGDDAAADPADVRRERSAGAGRAAGEASGPAAGAARCDLCGAVMIERHCKLSCGNCGYQRDCSDP